MAFDPSSRYQDRVESCSDVYQNPYRQDRDSARAYHVLQVQRNHSTDTLETKQQQLERNLLNQFQRNQFRLPLGKLIIIGQIGQFLILAITLPTYMFFYGAPKWLLEQSLPRLSRLVDREGERLEKFIMITSEWSSSLFKAGIARIQLLFKSKPKKPRAMKEGDNLFRLLAKDVGARLIECKKAFQAISKQFTVAVEVLVPIIGDILKSMQVAIASAYERLQQMILKRLNEAYLLAAEQLQRSLKNAQIHFKKPLDTLKRGLKTFSETISKRLESMGERFLHFIKQVQDISLRIYFPLSRIVKAAVVVPGQSMANGLVKRVEETVKVVLKGWQWVQGVVHAGLMGIARSTRPLLEGAERLATQLTIQLMSYYKKVARQLHRFIGNIYRLGQVFGSRWNKFWDRRHQKFNHHFEQAKKQVKKWIGTAGRAYRRLKMEMKLLPSRLHRGLIMFIMWAYQMLKKMLWNLRVGLTWVKIIMGHSLEVLRARLSIRHQ